MRPNDYNVIKKDIHDNGLTVGHVAAYMHMSENTFRRRYNRGAAEPEDLDLLYEVIRELAADKRTN